MLKKFVFVIIAILLAVDNVFIRYRIGSISYDRLLEIFIFFVFFKSYLQELRSNSFFRNWNAFLLAFAVLQLAVNFKLAFADHIPFEEVYEDFFKCFSFLVYSFLFLMIAKKDMKYVNTILYVHLLICIFGLLQHPLSPLASEMLEIKKLLYSQAGVEKIAGRLGTEEVYIEGGFANRYRLSGPFVSATPFSYFAITSFILSFYMYLRYRKRFYLLLLGVLFLASLLSQTRSLLLAEICLVGGYLFFTPARKHALYKLGLVTVALAGVVFLYTTRNIMLDGSSRLTQVSGNDSRPLLWLTGAYTVFNNPFGVSEPDYLSARKEIFIKFGNPIVLLMSTHNGLINLGFHYSVLGYLLFFFLVLFLLRYINLLEPRLRVFFRVALLAYLINASFHNNFVLNADYPFLMVLMLIWVDLHYSRTAMEKKM